MLEKLKQRSIHLNLKKAVIIFIVTGLVLVSVSFVAVYSNLRGKNIEWENIAESETEKETEEINYGRKNKSDLKGERWEKEDDREREDDAFDIAGIAFISGRYCTYGGVR